MKLQIKKIGKKGKGVFAAQKIMNKTKIIHKKYTNKDRIVSGEEINKLSKNDQNHLDKVGKDRYAVDYSMMSIVNHSCEPNCYVKYKSMNEKYLVSLRDIKKAEELTYDYAIDADPSVNWEMKCFCGAKTCRKKIYSNWNKLPDRLKKEYRHLVPKWKKRIVK